MSMPLAGRALRTVVLAGLVSLVAVSASRAQPQPDALHGFVTLSSNYVLNGLTQTYDGPSARVSLDFEHESGFFAGGSLANVGYEAEEQFRTPRDTQINVYAGYVWRRDQWMTNLTLSRYRYPGIERDYDYTQATANVSFRERYFIAVSRASEFLSIYDNADIYRAGVALPWLGGLEVGVNAGRLKSRGFLDASYTFWDVGLSRPLGRFALDLRYHDNTYEQSSLLGNDARDLWVLSASYAFLPIGQRGR
jgi:uncharacterized protein (TIGR02001 family)